jgi:hypothetical protein
MTDAKEILRQHNIAIGELLDGADADAKNVLRKYRADVSHDRNFKEMKALKNEVLEKCAEHVKLVVRSTDGESETHDKLYPNKGVLVDRLILKIESYLQDNCDECKATYRNKLDDEAPLLVCFVCSQGSHNCPEMRDKYDKVSACFASPDRLIGLHWLCQGCRRKSDLVFVPKPKNTKKAKPITQTIAEDTAEEEEEEEEADETDEKEASVEEQAISNDRRSPRRERCPVPTGICEKYKKLECPHGLTGKRLIQGKPCPKLHPRRCINYMRHGTDKKLGCTKGQDCKYYHPVLCRDSVKRRVCTREGCKFAHLKFTKHYEPDPQRPTRHHEEDRRSDPYRSQQHAPRVRTLSTNSRNPLLRTPTAREPLHRQQQQLQCPRHQAAPDREADANSVDKSFLSKLPQIIDQMQHQQKEIQAQLAEMIALQRPTLPGSLPMHCQQQTWQYPPTHISQDQMPLPPQHHYHNPTVMSSLFQQAMNPPWNNAQPTQASSS